LLWVFAAGVTYGALEVRDLSAVEERGERERRSRISMAGHPRQFEHSQSKRYYERQQQESQMAGRGHHDLSTPRSSDSGDGNLLTRLSKRMHVTKEGVEYEPPENDCVTLDDSVEWICKIGYPEYADAFRENQVDGKTLKTITAKELREDIGVRNPKHRGDILTALKKLVNETKPVTVQPLPEMGRILSLLSNVRTFQSWTLIAIQMLVFSIAYLRLASRLRSESLVGGLAGVMIIVGLGLLAFGGFSYEKFVRFMHQENPHAKMLHHSNVSLVAVTAIYLFVVAAVLLAVLIEGFV